MTLTSGPSLLIATSRSYRSFRLSRMISSVECKPVVAGTCADFRLLGKQRGRLSARQIFFSFAGRRALLREPIARWYVS
jgi:hypothetical protein